MTLLGTLTVLALSFAPRLAYSGCEGGSAPASSPSPGGSSSSPGSEASQLPPPCLAALAAEPLIQAGLASSQSEFDKLNASASAAAAAAAANTNGTQFTSEKSASSAFKASLAALSQQSRIASSMANSSWAYADQLAHDCGSAKADKASQYLAAGNSSDALARDKAASAREADGLTRKATNNATRLCDIQGGCSDGVNNGTVAAGVDVRNSSTVTGQPAKGTLGIAGAGGATEGVSGISLPKKAGPHSAAATVVAASAGSGAQAGSKDSAASSASGNGDILSAINDSSDLMNPANLAAARGLASLAPANGPLGAAALASAAAKSKADLEKVPAKKDLDAQYEREMRELNLMINDAEAEKRAAAKAAVDLKELSLFQRISRQYRHAERLL